MKKTLLCSILLMANLGFAQTPISSYYGQDQAAYALGQSAAPLDQSATGANINWNFTLEPAGTSIHTFGDLSAEELASYPGSNFEEDVLWTPLSGTPSESAIYSRNVSSTVSLTAFRNDLLELNCNTNNATIGAFPMNYGFSNTDPIAGTYQYDTYSGTFTGNIVTTVDAYGTLTVNIGSVPAGSSVTRLKTVQTISLFYGPFPASVGTATQTTYSYYGSIGVPLPLMRTSNTVINVPLLSVNTNTTDIEVFEALLLSTDSFTTLNDWQVQNPIGDLMEIRLKDLSVESVRITDLTGKLVLEAKTNNASIDVSQLSKGIYALTVMTNQGARTQKIVKN